MSVLGVWAQEGARELAETIARSRSVRAGPHTALVATDAACVNERTARVGDAATQSTISTVDDGLVLQRGPAWTAPIYYRGDARTFFASSSLSALVRPADTVDAGRIACMIGYASRRSERRSAYKEIQLLSPFERVTVSASGLSSVDRGGMKLMQLEGVPLPDLAAELRRRLIAVVSRAAENRRVAIMLSGGLDSSSILAALLASRGAGPDDVSVTLDFDAPGSDRAYVRALEDHYGIQVIRVRPKQAPVQDVLVMDAAPSRHHGDAWTVLCAREAHARGAEMLMTGTGGDQLFGGNLGAGVRAALLHANLRGAWDAFRSLHPYPISARYRLRMSLTAMMRPYLPRRLQRWRASRAEHWPPWAGRVLRDELRSAACERAEHRPAVTPQEQFDDFLRSPYESEYCAEARAQTDSISPIPRVDPLYDEELVRFLGGVPHEALFADGMYRGLLRLAMRDLLPESVRRRIDKSDFEPALAAAFVPFDRFEPLLSFEALDRAGIVLGDAFRRHLAPLYAAPAQFENGELWLDFCPALAAEKFLRSATP
jgi:asparagine synthase (glutamine-hydrolysing)